MYIRKRLTRHKSQDRVLLAEEHREDSDAYREALDFGEKFEIDIENISNFIEELSLCQDISAEDKEPTLSRLR